MKATDLQQLKTLKSNLLDLQESFNQLTDNWVNNNITICDIESILSFQYPFKSSFDDLNLYVNLWVDDSINKIDEVLENL